MKQYGILDDKGELFGLRGTVYNSLEAAEQALSFIRARRREMEVSAVAAQRELDKHRDWSSSDTMRARRAQLEEAVALWDREKHRTFSIRMREVSPWVSPG